jgi:HAD superfamily hydrolase (TIGR01544 family)
MHFCSARGVPFLIFSSGIGDLTQMLLASLGLITPNLHIIANFFTFDANEKVTGFQKDTVHTLNKDQSHVIGTLFEGTVENRPNVILLTDQISDKSMIEGIPVRTVLTVGFLNGIEKNRPDFEKEFDVVILEDTGMEFVQSILQAIQ